jgi:hypothetical protein
MVVRYEVEQRSPDDFVGRVAEEAVSGGIPSEDGSVGCPTPDRIPGSFDDRREVSTICLEPSVSGFGCG